MPLLLINVVNVLVVVNILVVVIVISVGCSFHSVVVRWSLTQCFDFTTYKLVVNDNIVFNYWKITINYTNHCLLP